MTAPIRTPRRRPEPSTPSREAMATPNSARLKRQSRRSSETLKSPPTAMSTIAASTGWGRSRRRPARKRVTTSMSPAATRPDTGVRAPPPSLTSDWDMPPLTGKP